MDCPATPQYRPSQVCKTPLNTNEDFLTYDAPDMTYYLTNVEIARDGQNTQIDDQKLQESSAFTPPVNNQEVAKRVRKQKTVPKIIAKLMKKQNKKQREAKKKRISNKNFTRDTRKPKSKTL